MPRHELLVLHQDQRREAELEALERPVLRIPEPFQDCARRGGHAGRSTVPEREHAGDHVDIRHALGVHGANAP